MKDFIIDFLLNLFLVLTLAIGSTSSVESQNYVPIECKQSKPKYIQINEYNDLIYRCGQKEDFNYLRIN